MILLGAAKWSSSVSITSNVKECTLCYLRREKRPNLPQVRQEFAADADCLCFVTIIFLLWFCVKCVRIHQIALSGLIWTGVLLKVGLPTVGC